MNTKKLIESYNTNLNEDTNTDINNMTMEEMKKKFAELSEDAGLSAFDIIEQLDNYGCLNTGSFRNMLEETIDYLNDNNN